MEQTEVNLHEHTVEEDIRAQSAGGESSKREQAPPGSGEQFVRLLSEWWENVCYYLSVRADQFKLSLRELAVAMGMVVLGGVMLGGVLVIAAWFAISGMAEGLGELFNAPWLGKMVAGLTIIGLFVLALLRIKKSSFQRTKRKYEDRKRQQEARFGRSVGGAEEKEDAEKRG